MTSVLDIEIDRRALLRRAFGRWGAGAGVRPPPGAEAILVFDENACWARQGIDPDCDYCYDRCPLKGKAVKFTRGKGPVFNPGECDGCGICIYYCPATPRPLSLI